MNQQSSVEFSQRPAAGLSSRDSTSRPVRPAERVEKQHFSKRLVARAERRLAYAIGAGLILFALALTPYAATPLVEMPGFIVGYAACVAILNVMVSVMLFSRALIEKDRGHIMLAAAYLYAGLIAMPQLAAFPNALAAGILLGASGSAIWLWVFWHVGFASLVIAYAAWAGHISEAPPRLLGALTMVALLVCCATLVSVRCLAYLPLILHGGSYFSGPAGHAVEAAVLVTNLMALGAVAVRFRTRNAEDIWLTVGMIGAVMDTWLTLRGGARFTAGWYFGRVAGLSTVCVLFMSLLNDLLLSYRSVTVANNLLGKLTFTDALTNLGNRRMFDSVLNSEWRRCWREGAALTVLMLDVDEFKSYNDSYGHQAGDNCLQRIAGQLQLSALRAGDTAMRYGGEEFAVILPATDSNGGEHLARLIRLRVRDLAMCHAASVHKVITVSIGVASLVPSDSFDMSELVRRADAALYHAKAAGRDTVMVAN